MTEDTDKNKYSEFVKKSKEFEKEFTKEQKDSIISNLNKINEKYFETEFTTPDHVYIELPLLKDVYIGTLFAMILNRPNSQELFAYIKSRFKDYQLRYFDDPISYFPELNISEEEFNSFLENPKNHNDIFTLAPFTLFRVALEHNLAQNALHSTVAERYTVIKVPGAKNGEYIKDFPDINFYINLHPLKLSEHNKLNFQRIIANIFGVNVVLLEADPKTISADFIADMDEINTFRIDRLMENESVRDKFSNFKFVGKFIYAPLLVNPELKDKLNSESVVSKDVKITTSILKCFSFFKWLEAARYAIDLDVYDDPNDNRSDEEIRESPLPSLEV